MRIRSEYLSFRFLFIILSTDVIENAAAKSYGKMFTCVILIRIFHCFFKKTAQSQTLFPVIPPAQQEAFRAHTHQLYYSSTL